jgi:hypothetical protein
MEDHIRRYLSVGDDGTIRVLKIKLFEDVSEYRVFKQIESRESSQLCRLRRQLIPPFR